MNSPVHDRLAGVLFPFEPRHLVTVRFWEPAPARCVRLLLGRSKFISQRNPTCKVLPTFQRPDVDNACCYPPSNTLLSQTSTTSGYTRPQAWAALLPSSFSRPRICSSAPRPSSRWKQDASSQRHHISFSAPCASCLCILHHRTVLFVYYK